MCRFSPWVLEDWRQNVRAFSELRLGSIRFGLSPVDLKRHQKKAPKTVYQVGSLSSSYLRLPEVVEPQSLLKTKIVSSNFFILY
jgi:hypothetical protein